MSYRAIGANGEQDGGKKLSNQDKRHFNEILVEIGIINAKKKNHDLQDISFVSLSSVHVLGCTANSPHPAPHSTSLSLLPLKWSSEQSSRCCHLS